MVLASIGLVAIWVGAGGGGRANRPCYHPPMPIPVPYAITRRDDGLLIEWDEAGHQALYPARGPPAGLSLRGMRGGDDRAATPRSGRGTVGGPAGVGGAGWGVRAPDPVERWARHRHLYLRAAPARLPLRRLPDRPRRPAFRVTDLRRPGPAPTVEECPGDLRGSSAAGRRGRHVEASHGGTVSLPRHRRAGRRHHRRTRGGRVVPYPRHHPRAPAADPQSAGPGRAASATRHPRPIRLRGVPAVHRLSLPGLRAHRHGPGGDGPLEREQPRSSATRSCRSSSPSRSSSTGCWRCCRSGPTSSSPSGPSWGPTPWRRCAWASISGGDTPRSGARSRRPRWGRRRHRRGRTAQGRGCCHPAQLGTSGPDEAAAQVPRRMRPPAPPRPFPYSFPLTTTAKVSLPRPVRSSLLPLLLCAGLARPRSPRSSSRRPRAAW